MALSYQVLFTLFILALLLISWLLGYYARYRRLPELRPVLDADYFTGLNYLLNDEPDDAIDVFIDALEVNSSTFETHLALGKLLKRRGKVDRAIAHYHSLLALQRFNTRQTGEIKIHLIRCYIAAGLLDRAEELLDEMKQGNNTFRADALRLGVMVHQIQKDWHLALDDALELLKITPLKHRHELQLQASHFHCELAEALLAAGDTEAARAETWKAMQQFKANVRPYMLAARIEYLAGKPAEAVAVLSKALHLDPPLYPEIAADLHRYRRAAGLPEEEEGSSHAPERELEENSSYLISVGHWLGHENGDAAALAHFQSALAQAPSVPLLAETMKFSARSGHAQKEVLEQGAAVLQRFLDSNPHYRCENCGFELRNLHWCCPGCNCWGMVRPIDDLIPGSEQPKGDPKP